MKRLSTYSLNLLLVIALTFGLSGCLASSLSFASSSPWEQIELGTNANPLDISFVDDKKGFLVGTDRLILETNDGGDTWASRELAIPSEENFRLISVDFRGDEGWLAGQPGLVMHSNDAGKNWTRLVLGGELPGDPYLIRHLDANSAELATTAGAIYRTIDGGANWEALVVDASATGGIRDLRRMEDGSYLGVSSLGNFFSIFDPKQGNWVAHQRASSKRVQSVGYTPDNRLWMLSRGAEIRFTANPEDKDDWGKPIIPIVNGYNYQDMAWDPNGDLWAAGGNGILLTSKDDGKSWEQDFIGDSVPTNFIRIVFTKTTGGSPIQGFVLGERGNLLHWRG